MVYLALALLFSTSHYINKNAIYSHSISSSISLDIISQIISLDTWPKMELSGQMAWMFALLLTHMAALLFLSIIQPPGTQEPMAPPFLRHLVQLLCFKSICKQKKKKKNPHSVWICLSLLLRCNLSFCCNVSSCLCPYRYLRGLSIGINQSYHNKILLSLLKN